MTIDWVSEIEQRPVFMNMLFSLKNNYCYTQGAFALSSSLE